VPNIKNDTVAFWDRPLVDRVCLHDFEKIIASPASIGNTLQQSTTNRGIILSGEHSGLLVYCLREIEKEL
jgi:hypothetical protein